MQTTQQTYFGYKPFPIGFPGWAANYANLPLLADAGFTNDPVSPVSQNAGWAAPQRDENRTPSVQSMVSQ